MKSRLAFIVGLAAVLALPLAIHAQSSSDPFLGTWKMDPAKSKFEPGPAPKSESRVYESTSDGSTKVIVQTTTATGAAATRTSTYKYDGKSYPVQGSANYDSIALMRVSASQVKTTLMRGGKSIGEIDSVVSKDGKVGTMTYTFTTPSGVKEHDVIVYDRQ
jgi:hypothetical protein